MNNCYGKATGWMIDLKSTPRFWGMVLWLACGVLGGEAYNPSPSYSAEQKPRELQGLEVKERLGSPVDLNRTFRNERGEEVYLSHYFQNNKPVLMTVIDYGCPNLCGLHLKGLSRAAGDLSKDFQGEFELVAVSMDHSETPSLARLKKQNYVQEYALDPDRVHFLTGSKGEILSLTRDLGFRFRWDEGQKIYAHHPVAYVLTPQGHISRYLYGVEFLPKTLRLSLVEASQNKIGSLVDRILLFCFQFDPNKGLYSWYAYNIMRVGGGLTVLLLLVFLLPVWLRENKKLLKNKEA